MKIKGIFASDIDNTLTNEHHIIPGEVVDYLTSLHEAGWRIVLLTGRTFSFAVRSFNGLNLPFILGVQNGAEVIRMPEGNVLFQEFLPREILTDLDKIFNGHSIGYIVYSGFEGGDFCYYEPHKFSEDMLRYFDRLKSLSSIPWVGVKTHSEIPDKGFPLVKGFGNKKKLCEIRDQLESLNKFDVCVINDVIDRDKGLLLITSRGVNKGNVLKRICQLRGWNCPIVAAGDDENDIPLFKVADFSICVKGGSQRLAEYADLVTESSYNLGVIQGMNQILREHFS